MRTWRWWGAYSGASEDYKRRALLFQWLVSGSRLAGFTTAFAPTAVAPESFVGSGAWSDNWTSIGVVLEVTNFEFSTEELESLSRLQERSQVAYQRFSAVNFRVFSARMIIIWTWDFHHKQTLGSRTPVFCRRQRNPSHF